MSSDSLPPIPQQLQVGMATILAGPLMGQSFASFLDACADQYGDIAVANAVPALWAEGGDREALLGYLRRSRRYDAYLVRARSWLAETPHPAHDLLRQVASDHVVMGQAHDFLRLIERLPDLRVPLGIIYDRLLLIVGRDAELRSQADISTADEAGLFMLGWKAIRDGQADRAAAFRIQIEALRRSKVAKQLAASNLSEPSPVTGGLELLAFAQTPVADIDPELASAVAFRAAAIMHALQPLEVDPALGSLTIPSLLRATAEQRQEISKHGLNPLALIACAADLECVETLAATDTESRAAAKALPRLSDEIFFYGHWGASSVSHGRYVNWLRGFSVNRGLRAICPWSLRPLVSTESYWFEGLLHYRFEGERIFWISSYGHQFLRSLFWVPDQDIVIGLLPQRDVSKARPVLTAFTAFLEREAPRVARYRASPKTPAALTGVHANIGHNYLNELSGLHRAQSSRLLPAGTRHLRLDRDYYNAFRILGIDSDPTELPNGAALTQLALDEGLTLVWPTDEAAYRNLGQRIAQVAEEQPMSAALAAALAVVETSDVALVIGLRTKRRAWLSQMPGICYLLSRLQQLMDDEDARIAVIFEGYTRTIDVSAQEEAAIAMEKQMVEALLLRPDFHFSGPVTVSIGLTLIEKARLFRHADLAVMPKGNGHIPTLAWVTNTPVVVHSNSADLAGVLFEIALHEDGKPPLLLDRDQSSDRLGPLMTSNVHHLPLPDIQSVSYDIPADRLALHVERLLRKCL